MKHLIRILKGALFVCGNFALGYFAAKYVIIPVILLSLGIFWLVGWGLEK